MPRRPKFVSRVGALAVLGLALLAAPASATTNNGPGTAPLTALGAPFTGTWAGLTAIHPVTRGGVTYPTQWWRVGPIVRTGDQVQVGIDNTQDPFPVTVCLVAPTDEYGADGVLNVCPTQERMVAAGRLDRFVLQYTGKTGLPFLIFYGGHSKDPGGYSAVIQQVYHVVKVGTSSPVARVRRKFTFRAFARYGDGTRPPDGVLGYLQWKRSGRNPGPASFQNLATARSVKGRLKFKAKLPRSTKNRIQLRTCVANPRGGFRCTPAERVRIKK